MSEVQSIQWFPGHMTRTKRQIEKCLPKVDLVAEIVDARVAVSSRNPVLHQLVRGKPRLILLNKCDMADPAETARWIKEYRDKGIMALEVDCKTGRGVNRFAPAVREVLKDRIAVWESKGMIGRPIRIMVVGIPNVGKSSLINKLCRGAKGKADVQDRPGVTRENRWFTIGNGLELLDTPGVLWPKFEDRRVGERLAFTGAVKDDILDREHLAARLLECLQLKGYLPKVCERYKLTPQDLDGLDGFAMLEKIGRKRGFLVRGGDVDTERAAITVLDEFRGGKIGRISLEQVHAHE